MKTLLLFSIFSIAALHLSAQSAKTASVLQNDTILNEISKRLPAGWNLSIDDTAITVWCSEPYVLLESDCSAISADSLSKIVRKDTAVLRFRYEEKWSPERIFWTRETNDSISIVVQSLPREMGIAHLEDKEKSTRYLKVYTGKTKDEKEKVNAYYKRKATIMQNYSALPNFNTSQYSLKLRSQTGMQKYGQCVYPYKVYKEALSVYILFLEYCENPLE